jgi:hypothetical protein
MLKRNKSPGTDQILVQVIEEGGYTRHTASRLCDLLSGWRSDSPVVGVVT